MIFYSQLSSIGLNNVYLIGPEKGGEAVVIDPGIFDTKLLEVVENNHLSISCVLITHSHEACTSGLKTIMKIYQPEIYSYRQEVLGFKSNKVRDFNKIKCGDYEFEVLETPGHTGDSICYRLNNYLFTGDALLAGSIGSAPDDFSKALTVSSLKEKLLIFDENFLIFPGHGPPSKLSIEKKLNPHLQ
ncbi:MAG: MBL fold metallo-hydrolase [Spirochaetales bacterium]|nr:MBL fold metallo-hydrolase [Spirochaetales bacterium]